MIYVIRWEHLGTHIHAKIFSGTQRGSLALNGKLAFREGKDWNLFTQTMKSSGDVEVIFEEEKETLEHG